MTRRLLLLLLVFCVASASAVASSSALLGAYKATITGKTAALNGKWRLEFKPKGRVHLYRNGRLVVVARATNVGRRLKIEDRSGSYACGRGERVGTYGYKAVGKRLTFTVISDNCVGRKAVLTTKPFVR